MNKAESVFLPPVFRLVLIIVLLSGVVFSQTAVGMRQEPQLVGMDVLEDPGGQLTISDVEVANTNWQAVHDNTFYGGYSRSAHWFRLKVLSNGIEQALLTMRPIMLDNVQLFVPQELSVSGGDHSTSASGQGTFLFYQQGDLFPYSQREKHWRGFSFALSLPDDRTHLLYLRVETTGSTVVLPELWSMQAFENYQSTESFILGTGIGLIIVLAILSALYWWVERDRLFAYFLFFSVSTLIFIITVTGLLGLYVLPDWPSLNSKMIGVAMAINGIASTLFVQHALDVKKISRRINQLLNAAIGFYGLCLCLALSGYWELVVRIFMLVASIHIVGSFLLAIFAWRKNNSLARYIVVAFGVALICRLLPTLGLLGVPMPSWMDLYPALVADMLRMLLLLPVITERASQMKQMREHAVQEVNYMKIKRDWMAMLTHEIKTPLALISSSNQNIQLLSDEDDILTRSRKITNGTQRIEDIIDNLLHSDAFDMRHRQLERTQFNLSSLIQQVVNDFPRERTTLQLHFPETLPLFADRELIRLTLNNLLGNALTHGPSDCPIMITGKLNQRQGKRGVMISVHDSGTPITPTRQARLFEKYGSFGHKAGSGIGLWACQEIVHAHGGNVWLETMQSEPRGNTFCLWLPVERHG